MSWHRFVLAAALLLILNGHILYDLSGRRLFFGQYQIGLSLGVCVTAWAALGFLKDRLTLTVLVGHAIVFLTASWLAMAPPEPGGVPAGAPDLRALSSRIAALYLGAGGATIGLLAFRLIAARWRRGGSPAPDARDSGETADSVLSLIRMTLAGAPRVRRAC